MGSDDNRKRNSGSRLSPETGKRTPRRLKKQKLTAEVGGSGSLKPEQTTGEKTKKRKLYYQLGENNESSGKTI